VKTTVIPKPLIILEFRLGESIEIQVFQSEWRSGYLI